MLKLISAARPKFTAPINKPVDLNDICKMFSMPSFLQQKDAINYIELAEAPSMMKAIHLIKAFGRMKFPTIL